MTTLTIPLDRLEDVRPGDRLVAIDDVPLSFKRVFTDGPRRVVPNGPVGIPFEYGSAVTGYLYPDSIVSRSITIERQGAEPEPVEAKPEPQAPKHPAPIPPQVFLHERERKALRRNRHYEETLRLLDDGKGGPVDLRTRIADAGAFGYFDPRHYSHQAGILATWYGWTERVADYTWRLTAKGQRVLAALDQQRKG